MRRIDVGVKQTDRQRLDLFILDQPGQCGLDLVLDQRGLDAAVVAAPFGHFCATTTRNQWLWKHKSQIKNVVTFLFPHIEHVGKARGRNDPGPGTRAFNDGMGHQCRTVHDRLDRRAIDAFPLEQAADAGQDC